MCLCIGKISSGKAASLMHHQKQQVVDYHFPSVSNQMSAEGT
jgi:hypothetical protein